MFSSIFGFPVQVNPYMNPNQFGVSSPGTTLQNAQLGSNSSQLQNNASASTQHSQGMLAQQTAAWNAAVSKLGQPMQSAQHRYMINGKTMTFDQFLDELCPESDDPMRTFLILKYKDTQ